jgi:hypothetical protein
MALRITIDLFSGRPNPVITLDDNAAAEVVERLGPAGTLKGHDAQAPPEPILGYRGVAIEQLGNPVKGLMAAGHGGQILLAESTAVLLSGVDLVDLGPRRLRDLPPRWECSRSRPLACARSSRPADAGCDAGEPAASGHQLHRPMNSPTASGFSNWPR